MQTKEWSFVDKSAWQRGVWDAEPDKIQWMTTAGLPGLIVRNGGGALCGYVGVADGHKYFSVEYGDCDVEVHGGLTFSDFCQPNHEHGICHTPDSGEPDRVWWLGFDCSHLWDVTPAYHGTALYGRNDPNASYRAIAYVRGEVESLARQLSEVQ